MVLSQKNLSIVSTEITNYQIDINKEKCVQCRVTFKIFLIDCTVLYSTIEILRKYLSIQSFRQIKYQFSNIFLWVP